MKINGIDRDIKHGTNVLELEVPPQLDITIDTGISFINDAFGGKGITPSAVTLFTGSPGVGKTTLMLQLANSLTKNGCIVLYNTREEDPMQVRRTTRRLGFLDGFVIGQDKMISDVLKHLDELREANPGKQVVLILDSLASHDDGFYPTGLTNSMTQVRITEAVTSYCKTHYTVAFIIGHVTKGDEWAGKQQIKHTIDSHLHFFFDRKEKSQTFGERIIQMQKNRWGASGISYIVGMDEKKGVYEKGSWE
jgi:DNA repair protein RadA/Sms